MKRAYIWIALATLLAGGFLFRNELKEINIGGLGSSPIEKTVIFSVIRFEGKAISVRLVVDSNGKLEARHLVGENDIGIAFYKKKRMIDKIESYDSYRYINVSDGFSHELVTKKIKIR